MAMGPSVSAMMLGAGLSGMNAQQQNEQQAAPGTATAGAADNPSQFRTNAMQLLQRMQAGKKKKQGGSGFPTLLGGPTGGYTGALPLNALGKAAGATKTLLGF